jgi:hypothetical protein
VQLFHRILFWYVVLVGLPAHAYVAYLLLTH